MKWEGLLDLIGFFGFLNRAASGSPNDVCKVEVPFLCENVVRAESSQNIFRHAVTLPHSWWREDILPSKVHSSRSCKQLLLRTHQPSVVWHFLPTSLRVCVFAPLSLVSITVAIYFLCHFTFGCLWLFYSIWHWINLTVCN